MAHLYDEADEPFVDISDTMEDAAPVSRPRGPRLTRSDGTVTNETILKVLEEVKTMLTAIQGRIETVSDGLTEVKRDFLVLKRGLPGLRTEGPTAHFRKTQYD